MSAKDEIKKWHTHSVKHKVATVLIMDGISFSYDENNGIMFAASVSYVENLKYRLITTYRCSMKPIINEIK